MPSCSASRCGTTAAGAWPPWRSAWPSCSQPATARRFASSTRCPCHRATTATSGCPATPTDQGRRGLVSERCAHRGASLVYGIPEADGLRCPYHGWKYDASGQCVEQPAEAAESTFRQRVCLPAYPVQEMGGLLWAYLGPAPAP